MCHILCERKLLYRTVPSRVSNDKHRSSSTAQAGMGLSGPPRGLLGNAHREDPEKWKVGKMVAMGHRGGCVTRNGDLRCIERVGSSAARCIRTGGPDEFGGLPAQVPGRRALSAALLRSWPQLRGTEDDVEARGLQPCPASWRERRQRPVGSRRLRVGGVRVLQNRVERWMCPAAQRPELAGVRSRPQQLQTIRCARGLRGGAQPKRSGDDPHRSLDPGSRL